jgi:hypothetical protein
MNNMQGLVVIGSLIILYFLLILIIPETPPCHMTIITRSKNNTLDIINYIQKNFPSSKIENKNECIAEDYYKAQIEIFVEFNQAEAIEIYCKKYKIQNITWHSTRDAFIL